MFSRIMVPVDLAHTSSLRKALRVAGGLAKLHEAEMVLVGVTAAAPGPLGHNPAEYTEKLEAFARSEASAMGVSVRGVTIVSHDPTTDVDDALLKAVGDTGADLVVMASHIPNLTDYLWPSNGGKIAAHSSASVFVVRG